MKTIFECLAERFPILYVAPIDENNTDEALLSETENSVRQALRKGQAPSGGSLSHFQGSSADRLWTEETPAGQVTLLYLENRADFETFLQILSHRCRKTPILPSVGAQTYFGLRNWEKIRAHRWSYLISGGADWPDELKRFAADTEKSCDTLIVLSEGPYSAVSWKQTGFSSEKWNVAADFCAKQGDQIAEFDKESWNLISLRIRTWHELAHVYCRRERPDLIRPLWDELTADAFGLVKAIGFYDAHLAAAFLGVSAEGYSGGRLAHYLPSGADPDDTARTVWKQIQEIETISRRFRPEQAYELLDTLLLGRF
ncbi:MAG: hypothetical protein J6P72_02110 [Firmicutes bacterium]|nr:hypothetical protein [Bacillota bacterium]